MLRAFVFLYMIVFLVIGVLGFMPNIMIAEKLFVVFKGNLWFNVLNVGLGVISFGILFSSKRAIRVYFMLIGILFAVLAALGFLYEEHEILGILANNMVNTWYYVIIAVVALILGFGSKE